MNRFSAPDESASLLVTQISRRCCPPVAEKHLVVHIFLPLGVGIAFVCRWPDGSNTSGKQTRQQGALHQPKKCGYVGTAQCTYRHICTAVCYCCCGREVSHSSTAVDGGIIHSSTAQYTNAAVL
ncbi:unnamed protein product [Pylaiella littoralis]